jgi:hypothetical protein
MTTRHLTLVPPVSFDGYDDPPARDESDTTPTLPEGAWTAPTDPRSPTGGKTAPVTPASANVTVGTVFERSWGYDQTNVDFYRVVGLTPKGVKIQKWSAHNVASEGNMHDSLVPGDRPARERVWPKVEQAELDACERCRVYTDGYLGEWSQTYAAADCPEHGSREQDHPVLTVRLSAYGGSTRPYVAVGPYSDHAYPWDGRGCYQTGQGYGH